MDDPTKPKKPSANPFEQGYQATATATATKPDNPFEQGFQAAASTPDAAPAESAKVPEPIDMGEGLGRSFAQGATFGFGDELRGALSAPLRAYKEGKGLSDAYRETRDEERGANKQFGHEHSVLSTLAETAGSLPSAVLAGPAGGIRAGAEFGAASALGHAEGSAKDQAIATGEGGVAGGAFGALGRLLAGAGGKVLDKINPARVVRREVATVLDDNAGQTFDMRNHMTPGTTPGELSPETAKLASSLGKNPRTAITGKQTASQRVEAVRASLRDMGHEYNRLGAQPAASSIPVDPQIQQLAAQAGVELDPAVPTSFAQIHRLRSDLGTNLGQGMTRHERGVLYDEMGQWLEQHAPGTLSTDSQYKELLQHRNAALKALGSATTGTTQAANRAIGAGTRQGNRNVGSIVAHMARQAIDPSPAAKAAALQRVAFTPANGEQEMQRILGARQDILQGNTPWAGRAGAQALGGMVAPQMPQLSNNANQAQSQAVQMRAQGGSDAQVRQQLGTMYTPEVVNFIVAATPQRLAQ